MNDPLLGYAFLGWFGLIFILTLISLARSKDYSGPSEAEIERLLRQQLPPMHGVQRNDKGEWERY